MLIRKLVTHPYTQIDRLQGRIHGIPDELLWSRLPYWFEKEGGGQPWWMAIPRSEGRWWFPQQGNYHPLEERQEFARKIAAYMNLQCRHGGAWMAGYLFQGRTFYMLWKDPDGDIQTPIEVEQSWFEYQYWKLEDFGAQGEQAWKIWAGWMIDMELKSWQQKKVAQGEPTTAMLKPRTWQEQEEIEDMLVGALPGTEW